MCARCTSPRRCRPRTPRRPSRSCRGRTWCTANPGRCSSARSTTLGSVSVENGSTVGRHVRSPSPAGQRSSMVDVGVDKSGRVGRGRVKGLALRGRECEVSRESEGGGVDGQVKRWPRARPYILVTVTAGELRDPRMCTGSGSMGVPVERESVHCTPGRRLRTPCAEPDVHSGVASVPRPLIFTRT